MKNHKETGSADFPIVVPGGPDMRPREGLAEPETYFSS
jgi:hypothetical protein